MTLQEKIRQLLEQKREAYAKWRDVMDTADREGRERSAEENEIVDRCEQMVEDCNAAVEALEAEDKRRQRMAEIASMGRELPPAPSLQRGETAPARDTRPLAERFRALMDEQGLSRTEALDHLAKQRDEEASRAFNAYLLGTRAALQQNSDVAGGFTLAPEQFMARLIQDLDNMVWFRQVATVIPLTGAHSMGVPSLDTDIADTEWTTELAVGTEDTSMAFGKRRLTPHPVAKYIRVSKDLLRNSALSIDAIVRERLAYKFGTVQESAFMSGNGAGRPLGIFTASAMGINTDRDVSTDNTNTAFTADGLINAKYTLTSPWLNSGNLRWVFHRDAVKMARKLKDGEGVYIWQPGLVMDRPDTILGVPVLISEYAPNTFTTLLYVGLIGDLSYYWIAETMSVEIQRLVELGALTNQDYFIGRAILDGMPVLDKAFVRVKLA